MHRGRGGDRLRRQQDPSKDADMPGWLSESRGTTRLMVELVSAQCRESIKKACSTFEMEAASAKAVAALTPADVPALLDALGPGQLFGLRDNDSVQGAICAAATPELYGAGGRVLPAWGSELGMRVGFWLNGMRRACREGGAEALVLYDLDMRTGEVFAEMLPDGLHTLMQKIPPEGLLRFKDSAGLASMLRGLRGSEERAPDVQLADRFSHSLRSS